MGTVVSIHLRPGALDPIEAAGAIQAACRVLHHADETFSLWNPDSPMSRLRAEGLGTAVPGTATEEISLVLHLCEQAKRLSGGYFDPWAMPGGLDPTGIVKGWAAERALEVLREAGAEGALVNAGGDVGGFGTAEDGRAWRVGIAHPWRPGSLAGVVQLDGAVATSGSYERGSHLIDPRDGMPALAAASATVVGPSLAIADALATALGVGGAPVLDRIAALDGYGAYLIGSDGEETMAGAIVFVPG